MTVLRNSFNGGTNTTVITTGNSGGTSGDALQLVSGSPTFSTTQSHSPSLSCQFPATAITTIGYQMSATTLWVRVYAYLGSHHAMGLLRLWSNTGAGGSFLGGISTKANGNLDLNSNGTIVDVSAAAVALNQWIRIEAMFSTTGGASVELYNSADSGTPSATASMATNMPSACLTQELIRLSAVTTPTFFDDIAVSDQGPLGPAVDPAPRPPLIAATAIHRASRW
jgi:hypothetical protein